MSFFSSDDENEMFLSDDENRMFFDYTPPINDNPKEISSEDLLVFDNDQEGIKRDPDDWQEFINQNPNDGQVPISFKNLKLFRSTCILTSANKHVFQYGQRLERDLPRMEFVTYSTELQKYIIKYPFPGNIASAVTAYCSHHIPPSKKAFDEEEVPLKKLKKDLRKIENLFSTLVKLTSFPPNMTNPSIKMVPITSKVVGQRQRTQKKIDIPFNKMVDYANVVVWWGSTVYKIWKLDTDEGVLPKQASTIEYILNHPCHLFDPLRAVIEISANRGSQVNELPSWLQNGTWTITSLLVNIVHYLIYTQSAAKGRPQSVRKYLCDGLNIRPALNNSKKVNQYDRIIILVILSVLNCYKSFLPPYFFSIKQSEKLPMKPRAKQPRGTSVIETGPTPTVAEGRKLQSRNIPSTIERGTITATLSKPKSIRSEEIDSDTVKSILGVFNRADVNTQRTIAWSISKAVMKDGKERKIERADYDTIKNFNLKDIPKIPASLRPGLISFFKLKPAEMARDIVTSQKLAIAPRWTHSPKITDSYLIDSGEIDNTDIFMMARMYHYLKRVQEGSSLGAVNLPNEKDFNDKTPKAILVMLIREIKGLKLTDPFTDFCINSSNFSDTFDSRGVWSTAQESRKSYAIPGLPHDVSAEIYTMYMQIGDPQNARKYWEQVIPIARRMVSAKIPKDRAINWIKTYPNLDGPPLTTQTTRRGSSVEGLSASKRRRALGAINFD